MSIVDVDRNLRWNLDEQQIHYYADNLIHCVTSDHSDEDISKRVQRYHNEHDHVDILRDKEHMLHEELWKSKMHDIVRILRHNRLDWTCETAISFEDLRQIALVALVKSLPNYCYASAFSTWMYTVVTHAVQNYFRHLRAKKRQGCVNSLDRDNQTEQQFGETGQEEQSARLHILENQINTVLLTRLDERAKTIFWLWHQGHKLREMSVEMGVHQSRISAILKNILQVLEEHPDIRSWDDEKEDEL